MTLVGDARESTSRSGEFDRTPPQAIEAEQSVLGAMMLSKDAIADVIERIRPGDFYRPAHQQIYDAVIDLYTRGEPADAVTVSAELTRVGQLNRVGGAPYLHTLISMVPTAANAGYYAAIVADRATLRRLVTAGTRIVQMGYDASSGSGEDLDGSIDDVVDRAQVEIYDVTERRTAEDYVHIGSLLENTLDEIERISATGGIGTGIPTGFQQLDEITNGLHAGQMVTVAGRPGSGKALALDTPLVTPTGWTTMGDVQVGDHVMGADGRPTRVVATTDVMSDRPCYEVTFSDGSVIVADAEHQWLTKTRADRRTVRSAPVMPTCGVRTKVAAHLAELVPAAGDDALVSVRELVAEFGPDARTMLERAAWSAGSVGRATRSVAGPQRAYDWRTPVYLRLQVLAELERRASGSAVRSVGCEPGPQVRTTEQIAASVVCPTADRRLNHSVACAAPLQLDDADLLVPPYLLGAWLGDGTSASATLTCADEQILDLIRAEGIDVVATGAPLRYRLSLPASIVSPRSCEVCGARFQPALPQVRTCGQSCGGKVRFRSGPVAAPRCSDCGGPVNGWDRCATCRTTRGTVQARLRTVGVLGNKHIPTRYLRAGVEQRRALLRGLLDTDGYATATGSIEFAVTNKRLAYDVRDLVVGLGYKASLRTKAVPGRTPASSTCFTVAFTTNDRVFGLDRKAARQVTAIRPSTSRRFITAVRRIRSVPVRCIQVDNDDHLYLAGPTMIPTHNSTIALDFARSAAVKHQKPTAIFSLEMGKLEIMMRLFSAEAGVALQNMRSGHMNDQDWTRLARRSSELAEAPLYIDDSPNLTMMEIRAKARRLKQRQDLQLIVIDYLQLMTSGKRVESRQQEVSEFSRATKLLAKELEVPVVVLSQLNRSSEQRTDKKPMLSDLRESGSIEQDSDMVLLVHRPDLYEPETERAGEADLIIAKHRNGPTATVAVAFQGRYSRFADMPS
ncbi:replicative DNA helicase [uncultured Jatrophihabitans sp.]|uniref:replicative DNA helicase n=1 Tax=uncultured Jatrophihabitans sp. TaxID=1610747 RepID=UPI0035C9B765